MKVKIFNPSSKETGEMELPKVFELPWNADLVHQVVTSQAANRRPRVAHVKDRGEVRGGGRKPWRQKGTGRARHGSIRSPLWKGGGVTHGPTHERSFKKKINRKMAVKALATVLSAKVRDQELLVAEELRLAQPKTKEAVKYLQHFPPLQHLFAATRKRRRILVVFPHAAPELQRAFHNIPHVDVAEARNITALDVVNRMYVVLPREGIVVLAQRLHG